MEFRRVLFRSSGGGDGGGGLILSAVSLCRSGLLRCARNDEVLKSPVIARSVATKQSRAAQSTCAGLARIMISAKPVADRKSVVEGKSVSVRVDFGGWRNNKKKKT